MTEAEAISLLLKVAREWLTEYPFVASAEKVREAVRLMEVAEGLRAFGAMVDATPEHPMYRGKK